jgi:hypothetical protein
MTTSYKGIVKRKSKIVYVSRRCDTFAEAARRADHHAARHGGTAYVRTCT